MNLVEFLSGHNIMSIYTPEKIILWLDKKPVLRTTSNSQSEFEWVVLGLSFASIAKLFAVKDVSLWLSQLAIEIDANNEVILELLGVSDSERKGKIKLYFGQFVKGLNEIGEINVTMQQLIVELLGRHFDIFEILLYLLVASDVITELEMIRLAFVELKPTQKRWQSLGLESPPVVGDLPI